MNEDKKRKKHGLFLGILFILCHAIADYFASGVLFRIFSSNKKAEQNFENSATVTLFKRLKSKTRPVVEYVKKSISRQFENSFVLKLFYKIANRIFRIPGKALGTFTATWGIYVIIISSFKRFVLEMSLNVYADILCGVIVLLASVPLIFTDKPISALCAESKIIFFVLTKVFGVPPETLKTNYKTASVQSIAVIFGILFGLLTYLVPPIDMVLCAIMLILLGLILAYPEGGVVISIGIAPLLGFTSAPSRILAATVLFTAASYAIKVIRGKRVHSFGVTDLAFTAFWIAVFIAGIAPGESNTLEHAILCGALMLIFRLTVNLMKYRRWTKICVGAFIVPAVIVAFVGIAQYSLGLAPSGWIDESIFGEISSRAVSLFNNPNILGVYLTMIFPFALTLTLQHNPPKLRVLGYIISAFVVVCTVFTYSRSAWIALVAGGLLFAVMISPKGILWTIPVTVTVAGATLLLPDTVGSRIMNFYTVADSANAYRVSIWNSSWQLLSDVFAGGIGMGEEAFKTAYIGYATGGTQYAMHSHSLYMQIVIQLGLIGLILFVIFLFNVTRKCCSSLVVNRSDAFLNSATKASLAGACALLVSGVFDYTWYNYRVFFMFWALLGFACAAANLNNKNGSELYLGAEEERLASITIPIRKRNKKSDLSDIEKEVMDNDRRE
ncbi:MAG: O-antigen ligase family protein [Clostridia bacterium]|nr:O-antigen ligase family protein [Clostridia bacterium]